MTADERTIGAIEDVRLTHLEAQVVQIIATRMGLDAAAALGVWYESDLCRSVELNEFGLQYLARATSSTSPWLARGRGAGRSGAVAVWRQVPYGHFLARVTGVARRSADNRRVSPLACQLLCKDILHSSPRRPAVCKNSP